MNMKCVPRQFTLMSESKCFMKKIKKSYRPYTRSGIENCTAHLLEKTQNKVMRHLQNTDGIILYGPSVLIIDNSKCFELSTRYK